MPIGQRISPTRKSPTKGKPKKLIPTNGSTSAGQYGAMGFKPSNFTPSPASPSKQNSSRNTNFRDRREMGSSFGNNGKILKSAQRPIDNSKMVQIEVEQGVPDDIKSYYSSNSQSGMHLADQLNGKGPPTKNLNIITKDDPEPEPTRPIYNFPLVNKQNQIPAFVDLSSPKGIPTGNSNGRGPHNPFQANESGFDLDQIMQDKEYKKKLEAQKNQTYLSHMVPSSHQNSQNSLGRKPSPNQDFVNRLSQQSPRRYNKNTIDQVTAQSTYDFKPKINQKSVKMVQDQVQQGKWENVNNVYDHLSKDVNERAARQSDRMNETKMLAKYNNQRVISPNNKSNNILANKFKDEFQQAVQTLTKTSNNNDLSDVEERTESNFSSKVRGISDTLNFQQTRNIVFCLGFTKQLEGISNVVTSGRIEKRINHVLGIWEILECTGEDPQSKRGYIKTTGLFNFLSYLQSMEFMVMPHQDSDEFNESASHNNYGFCLDGIFFIKTPYKQKELIKDFYDLLSNKKTFDRNINSKANQIKIKNDMRANETFRPALAPGTTRHISVQRREQMSVIDYSNTLATRSTSKLQKLYMLKQENEKKIDKQCTFVPKINVKLSNIRSNSNSTGRYSDGSRSNGPRNREQYVDNYLYKPKYRKDKSSQEIEYDMQKQNCSFKPKLKNTKTIATSKIKLYINNNDSSLLRKTTQKTIKNDRLSAYSGQRSNGYTANSRGSSRGTSQNSDGQNRRLTNIQTKQFQQYGVPLIAQDSESSSHRDQLTPKQVLLQMEVMISKNNIEYLVVLKGDDYPQVVRDFVRHHNLSVQKHQKLLKLVEQNIQNQ